MKTKSELQQELQEMCDAMDRAGVDAQLQHDAESKTLRIKVVGTNAMTVILGREQAYSDDVGSVEKCNAGWDRWVTRCHM